MKEKVRERWSILRVALREGKVKNASTPHPSYSFFQKEDTPPPPPYTLSKEYRWEKWEYAFNTNTKRPLFIRQKENNISLSELLLTSDNTGNIRIWPSEEVLSHFCLQHLDLFSSKIVCELAAGSSGLAGLYISLYGNPSKMYITDGDEQATNNIECNIAANSFTCSVNSRHLLWGNTEMYKDLIVDVIIAADCLFLEQYHDDLLRTITEILKPDGQAIFLAPRRGLSFSSFVEKAKQKGFNIEIEESYDFQVNSQYQKLQTEANFNSDLHYPLLLRLKKKAEDT